MKRTIEELRKNALLHWPKEIVQNHNNLLEALINSHDNFCNIISENIEKPLDLLVNLKSSKLSASLFLKHLMLLSDIGGEALNKLSPVSQYFEASTMEIIFQDLSYKYPLVELKKDCSLTNSSLKVDQKKVFNNDPINKKQEEIIILLIFGNSCINDSLPLEVRQKCNLSDFLGCKEELNQFLIKRYLAVSKQISGAKANDYGHDIQNYVAKKLIKLLPNFSIEKDSSIPKVSITEDKRETNFDIVVKSPNYKYFAIEISFQVTTNSVIERKARESKMILNKIRNVGHKMIYVIDGAGNINVRKTATKTLIENSDLSISLGQEELQLLASFIKKYG